MATHHRDRRVAARRERVQRLLGSSTTVVLPATAPGREIGIEPIKGVLGRACEEL